MSKLASVQQRLVMVALLVSVAPTSFQSMAQSNVPPPPSGPVSGFPAGSAQQPAYQNQRPTTPYTGTAAGAQYAPHAPTPGQLANQPTQATTQGQPATNVAGASQQPTYYGPSTTLKDAVGKALLTNPEVLESYHLFRAAVEDVKVARADFFPTIDYTGNVGRQKDRQSGYDVGEDVQGVVSTTGRDELNTGRYTRSTPYSLTLNQMIFRGFGTINNVRQYGKSKVKAYYDLIAVSEDIARQAAEAYYEVIRYRLRLGLTEDFYVLHRAIYEQIARRVQQGVGKRVDQDQAASRLALAEANVTTETSNLHDRSARYQRIMGELPGGAMYGPNNLASAMPGSELEAQRIAFLNNPNMRSAVENVMVYHYARNGSRSRFYPQISITANADRTRNLNDIPSTNRSDYVEANANWNLFRGGADLALMRKQGALRYAAFDLREKACRDLRQSLSIAYSNSIRERRYHESTATQVILLERARDAYREQYNIGQRSLLDLLDTENELFNARLSAVDSEVNLAIAYFTVYQHMGKLLDFLGFRPHEDEDDETPEQDDIEEMRLEDMCPVEAPVAVGTDRAELDRRALALIPTAAPAPAHAPAAPRTISLSADALFRLAKASLQPRGKRELEDLAAKYKQITPAPTSMRIVGYTDRLGSDSYNQDLSERRASTVRNYLANLGIPVSIMSTEGRGESNPVTGGSCTQRPESGRNRALVDCLAPDRRVEVIIH